jgi:hypothetical protein
MKRGQFIFGVHIHQFVRNFGQGLDVLDKMSYYPVLQELEWHVSVKCVFHVTGPLLEWFEVNRPKTEECMKILVRGIWI